MCVSNTHFKAPGSPGHRLVGLQNRHIGLDANHNVLVAVAFTGLADLSAVTERLCQIRAWSGARVWRCTSG